MSTSSGAKSRLMSEYKDLEKEKWVNIELKDGSLFNWSIGLMVINPESYFDGGYFKAEMAFPSNYPFQPPSFRFKNPIFHPNIYPDGRLCISILHAPGDDITSGELATERWSPLQGVESVLRSVLLLLDDPEVSSPANVDAGVMYRNDRSAYADRARKDVQKSKKDIPEGFEMPSSLAQAAPMPKTPLDDDNAFWAETDEEEEFGGSDSSGEDEDEEMQDFDEDGDQEFDESEGEEHNENDED